MLRASGAFDMVGPRRIELLIFWHKPDALPSTDYITNPTTVIAEHLSSQLILSYGPTLQTKILDEVYKPSVSVLRLAPIICGAESLTE